MTESEPSGADQIAEAQARERRMIRDLNMERLVPITGVVSPGGGGASHFPGDDSWIFRFSLEFWRINGGDVQARKIDLRKQVSEQEREALFDQLKPYTLVEMQARVLEETDLGGPQGLLHQLERKTPSDAELEARSQSLLEPVEFTHPVFGIFALNRGLDWYVAKFEWGSHSIELTLDANAGEGLDDAVRTAEALWEDRDDWHRKSVDFAAQHLLELKNESWLGENEVALSQADFIVRMELRDITVLEGGDFDFWYADCGMFLGHSIRVTGNLACGLIEARIEG